MGSALPELRQHVPAVVHGPLMCRGATSEGAAKVRSCTDLFFVHDSLPISSTTAKLDLG
jgi:hypothetical protein